MSDNNGSANGGQPGANGAGGEWYAGIADEGLRGYVQTKGFKDVGVLADSYRNLEKLVGVPQDRLVRLPDKSDAPEWDDVYSRLGRPDKPEGYELNFDGDAAFASRMATKMHALGISKSAAQGLNAEWNTYVGELIEADTREKQQKDATDMQALKTEWGNDYAKHEELARRAGREFGLAEAEFQAISSALGSSKTLKLFQSIGAKMAEPGAFDPGQSRASSFGLTPDAAKAQINVLMGDKDWTAKYLGGDKAAAAEMTRLQQIAAGQQA